MKRRIFWSVFFTVFFLDRRSTNLLRLFPGNLPAMLLQWRTNTKIYNCRCISGLTVPSAWNFIFLAKSFPKHRLHKSDKNFFFRAAKLFNIISRTTEKPMTKKLLTEMYQNYFHRSYNELDSCTWRILCNCGICNPMKKLVPNENWRVPHPRAPTPKTLLLLLHSCH